MWMLQTKHTRLAPYLIDLFYFDLFLLFKDKGHNDVESLQDNMNIIYYVNGTELSYLDTVFTRRSGCRVE